MEKITFKELIEGARTEPKKWNNAVIVFTESTFNKVYSEQSRSYQVVSTAKYFDVTKHGNSLFADCLDESEKSVRLDHYIADGWEIDYCYIVN